MATIILCVDSTCNGACIMYTAVYKQWHSWHIACVGLHVYNPSITSSRNMFVDRLGLGREPNIDGFEAFHIK